MDNTQIEALLERYWEGETTLQEERLLKQYFTQQPVDARFKAVAPLFQTLVAEQQTAPSQTWAPPSQAPAPFKVSMGRMWYKMSAAAAIALVVAAGVWYWHSPTPTADMASVQEVQKPAAALNNTTTNTPSTPEITENTQPTPQIAQPKRLKPRKTNNERLASHTPLPATATVAEESYTEADAQKALEEVKAALALVASKMNKGARDAARPLSKVDFEHYIVN